MSALVIIHPACTAHDLIRLHQLTGLGALPLGNHVVLSDARAALRSAARCLRLVQTPPPRTQPQGAQP